MTFFGLQQSQASPNHTLTHIPNGVAFFTYYLVRYQKRRMEFSTGMNIVLVSFVYKLLHVSVSYYGVIGG